MTSPQMLLALQLNNGYGNQPGAWRLPGVNLSSYTDMDTYVRHARAAERGKIQLIFLVDTPVLDVDLEHEPPHFAIDPLLVLTAIARETERIGLVATGSTTFNEPFTIARQFKALDVISHGRAGWNAVTTSHPAADVADHMQAWFEAGACDGFTLAIDSYHDGIDAFVDQVVPILQERELFHRDYEGSTLRDHLGAPAQYGLDPRVLTATL